MVYTLYAISLKEQTGDVIMSAQFEDGNNWTKTHNAADIGDEYDNESIMMS